MKIKAVEFTAPKTVSIVDDKLPDPDVGQVQVKTLYSGISHGTEMNVYRGDAPMWEKKFDPKTRLFVKSDGAAFKYPMRYGYCCVGEVTKIGKEVTRLKEGDLVYCEASHATGHVVSEKEPKLLPKGLSPKAGIFFSNLKTTFIGMLDASVRLQECLVVFGQGTLGQFIVQWAKLAGATPVVAVDLNEKRLGYSKKISGADITLNPGTVEDVAMEVKRLTNNRGADVIVEVSASDRALNEAIRTICFNGRVVVLSWYPKNWANVDPTGEFHLNRVQLISSQCTSIDAQLSKRWNDARVTEAVLNRMPQLNLEPLISHEIDIEDAAKAYEMIAEGNDDLMQVVLKH